MGKASIVIMWVIMSVLWCDVVFIVAVFPGQLVAVMGRYSTVYKQNTAQFPSSGS